MATEGEEQKMDDINQRLKVDTAPVGGAGECNVSALI